MVRTSKISSLRLTASSWDGGRVWGVVGFTCQGSVDAMYYVVAKKKKKLWLVSFRICIESSVAVYDHESCHKVQKKKNKG